MVSKQIPRIPIRRKRSLVFVLVDAAVSAVLLAFLFGSAVWLGLLMAGRTDVLSYRECVGVGLGFMLFRVVDLAVLARLRGESGT